MSKITSQRILGGVVLAAAAVLFLPLMFSEVSHRQLDVPLPPAEPQLPRADALVPAGDATAIRQMDSVMPSDEAVTFFPVTDDAVPAPVDSPADVPMPAPAPAPATAPTVTTTLPPPVRVAPTPPVAAVAPKPAAPRPTPPNPVAPKPAAPKPAAPKPAAAQPAATQPAATSTVTPPVAPAAVPASEPFTTAWVVQTASLSTRAAAEQAVARLTAKGYRATLAEANGRWRVFVGPELTRTEADAISTQIRADRSLGMEAIVRPFQP